MKVVVRPLKPRRKPERLTEEQQQLAAEAWGYVAAMAAEAERRFPLACAASEVACRIVRAIPTYDPRLSSLKTWAKIQARGAILDAQRASVPPGVKRGQSVPRTEPLATGEDDPTGRYDPLPEWEEMEAARHWLRDLRPREQGVLLDSIAGDEPPSAIAEALGVSRSLISKLRINALERLRYARSDEYAAWSGRESA